MPSTDEEQLSRRDNWHQSSVDTILGCPRRYALNYELGFVESGRTPAVIGTAVHAALEEHELARMNGESVTFEEIVEVAYESLQEEISRVSPDDLDDADVMAHLRAETEATIDNWWYGRFVSDELPNWEGSARDYVLTLTPVAVEEYLHADVVDGCAPLAGTLDGIYMDENKNLVMLDWKTANALSDWKKPDGHRHQATFYSALILLGGVYPTKTLPAMKYVVIRRGKIRATSAAAALLTVQPDARDIGELGSRVRKAERYKDEGVYPADPRWRWCKTCPFQPYCAPGTGELLAPIEKLRHLSGTAWQQLAADEAA